MTGAKEAIYKLANIGFNIFVNMRNGLSIQETLL